MKIFLLLFFITLIQSQSTNHLVYKNNLDVSENKTNNNAFIALALSAVLPGAGQIYNKNYKRGIAYLAFELINLSKRSKYLDKGDEFVVQYKNFANNHWSFNRWISDLNIYADESNPVNSVMLDPNNNFFYPWDDSHHIEFYLDGYLRRTNSSNGDSWFENTYKTECNDAFVNNQECNVKPNNRITLFSASSKYADRIETRKADRNFAYNLMYLFYFYHKLYFD